jgi:hypothetical protein
MQPVLVCLYLMEILKWAKSNSPTDCTDQFSPLDGPTSLQVSATSRILVLTSCLRRTSVYSWNLLIYLAILSCDLLNFFYLCSIVHDCLLNLYTIKTCHVFSEKKHLWLLSLWMSGVFLLKFCGCTWCRSSMLVQVIMSLRNIILTIDRQY